ncbi:MAG: glycerol-3-phosphate dehydrogenase/oxidase, partial [Rudaea sp.]
MAQLSLPEFDGESSGMTVREAATTPTLWGTGWRDRVWEDLSKPWDIVVIGGGITGAGIVREAARAGLRVLLVDANDFSAGTSSRSGKMVHGGLRYLQSGQVRLTIESVAERERLLREGRGLITSQSFLLPSYATDRPPMWVFGLGLTIYDLLALKWGHRSYSPAGLAELCPQLGETNLVGGFRFFDAVTDDSRLVLRVLREAARAGAVVLNYARADELLRCPKGQVKGIALTDASPEGRGRCIEVFADVVINATGAWADTFRGRIGRKPRLRLLRGSHLIFPWSRLPLARAVTFLHPSDHRALYALPWEGAVLVGTTDVDHGPRVEIDPAISQGEVDYLFDGLKR